MYPIESKLHAAWVAAEQWQARTSCGDAGRLHHETGLLRTLVREIADELAVYKNERVPGGKALFLATLGDAAVRLDYTYEDGWAEVERVYVDGAEVPLHAFSVPQVEAWRDAIAAHCRADEQAGDAKARADHQRDAFDYRRAA